MSAPTLNVPPLTIVGRDATLLTMASVNPSTSASSDITGGDILALFQDVTLTLEREYTNTKATNDTFQSGRVIAWATGSSVELKGLQKAGTSGGSMAAIFNSGANGLLSFSDGDHAYQVVVQLKTFKHAVSEKANEDSLTLPVVSEPFMDGAAMVLEA
jgi:hypothetical protein